MELVDVSPADAFFFWNPQMIHARVHSCCHILGYLGMPDPAVPNDLNALLGIVKLTRALVVKTIIEHLSSALDIASETQVVKDRSSLTEDELRCVYSLYSKI